MARIAYTNRGFYFAIDGLECGIASKAEPPKLESKKVEISRADQLSPLVTIGHPTLAAAKCDFALTQMGKPLMAWINELWQRNTNGGEKRRTATLQALDTDGKVQDGIEMYECQITGLNITDLAADTANPVMVTMEIQPEYIKRVPGDGKQMKAPTAGSQKLAQTQNFLLEIDGITNAKNASKVSGLAFKVNLADDWRGDTKYAYKVPTSTTYTDLKFTIAERFAKEFYDKFEDFAVQGNRDEKNELSGRVVLMDTSLQKELAEYRFQGAQILNVSNSPTDAAKGTTLKTIDVSLFITDAQFEVKV